MNEAAMPDQPCKILLVEPDGEMLEMLVASLSRHLFAHITCVADADGCLEIELSDPHDLVITELTLSEAPGLSRFPTDPEGDAAGLDLCEKLLGLSNRPVVLLADQPTCDDVLSAIRLGIRDVLCKPFPIDELLEVTDRALSGQRLRRTRSAKYRRMRQMVQRVLRERRDLSNRLAACQKRIDLVCRDLVGAQRRLTHRFAQLQSADPST